MANLATAEARTKHRLSPDIIAGEYQVRYGYSILQVGSDGVEIDGKGQHVVILKRPNFLAGDIFDIKLISSGSGAISSFMGNRFASQHVRILETIDMILDQIIEYVHDNLDDFPELQRDSDFDTLSYDSFSRLSQLVLKNRKDNPIADDSELYDERDSGGKKATKGQLIAILVGCGIVGIIAFTFHALLGVAILAFSGIAGYALSTGYYKR
ncbi:MAG: hypothetical protein ACOY5B_18860 [Spirochaetota bacterium]